MSNQNRSIIRIGLGDYAKGKRGPLYKEILGLAKQNKVVRTSVFKSVDGFHIKGNQEVVRLFGGIEKSQALIIEALIKSADKEAFPVALKALCHTSGDRSCDHFDHGFQSVFGYQYLYLVILFIFYKTQVANRMFVYNCS